jgi:hypothetical protein
MRAITLPSPSTDAQTEPKPTSSTNGATALCAHILASRGQLSYRSLGYTDNSADIWQ